MHTHTCVCVCVNPNYVGIFSYVPTLSAFEENTSSLHGLDWCTSSKKTIGKHSSTVPTGKTGLLDWQDNRVGPETNTGGHHEWMINSRISIRFQLDIDGAQSQMTPQREWSATQLNSVDDVVSILRSEFKKLAEIFWNNPKKPVVPSCFTLVLAVQPAISLFSLIFCILFHCFPAPGVQTCSAPRSTKVSTKRWPTKPKPPVTTQRFGTGP